MKVVHLCLGSFFPDNHAYQENMLPKYHKLLGYDVEVIASTQSFDDNGKVCYLTNTNPYQNEYNIKVTRLPYKSNNQIWKKLKRYVGTEEALVNASPDILFIHGCQFLDIDKVVDYIKKNPHVKVFVDNHADYSNSATNWISKNFLHKHIWKKCAHKILPYVTKFYGVLPRRVDFLVDVYDLPKEKCELLVMGGDDELIGKAKDCNARRNIREQLGINDNDFLIVTGGKINQYRPEVLKLMEAVIEIDRKNVKLLVFGSVSEELQEDFNALNKNDNILYVGWIKSVKTYDYISAGDLVVFPGLHSVMWEQAVAQGIPCIFRDIEGFHHVDLGGNALFLDDITTNGIKNKLLEVIDDNDLYEKMKQVAQKKGLKIFSYRDIAKRSII